MFWKKYQEHLSHLLSQINALVEEAEEYKIIQSIPGPERPGPAQLETAVLPAHTFA